MDRATYVPIDRLLAHREWVRRVARSLVRDENDADDLEQGVWLEALQRPPRAGGSIRGWFATALRHDSTDSRRSETCRARREESQARAEAIPSVADLVAEADAHKRVVIAVMALDEPYRSTILYRYFEDVPPSVIAARQGVPLETVRTRLRRALVLLRARFDAENGGDRASWAIALAPLTGGLAKSMHAASATAGGSTATTVLVGGLLMKASTKAAVAVVVLLLGGFAGWQAQGGSGRTVAPRESATSAVTPRPSATARPDAGGDADAATSARVGAPAGVASVPTRPSTDRGGADPGSGGGTASEPSPNGGSRRSGGARPTGAGAAPVSVRATPVAIPPDLPSGPAGPKEIVGRVLLLPGRTPVAGALVSGRQTGGSYTVTTGRNGVFRLTAEEPGRYRIEASLEGHGSRHFVVVVPEGRGVDGADVCFGGGGSLEGRVTGPDGPVVGALITIRRTDAGVMTTHSCRTEPDGSYRFDDLPPRRVTIEVEDDPHREPRSAVGVPIDAGRTTTHDFVADASLHGWVTEYGVPLEAALVRVAPVDSRATRTQRETTTEGEFRIAGLQAGETDVTVQVPRSPGYAVHVAKLALAPGVNELAVELGGGDLAGEISGRVVARTSGEAVPDGNLSLDRLARTPEGAWTVAAPNAGYASLDRTTAEFRIPGLRAGRYVLRAQPGRRGLAPATLEFDLAFGEKRRGLEVVLDAEPSRPSPTSVSVSTLAGSITDVEDRPVTVGVLAAYDDGTGRSAGGAIDDAGRYVFERLEPGTWRLTYRMVGGPEYRVEIGEARIAVGANALDLRLPAGEVVGRVFARSSGRPLAWREVTLTLTDSRPDGTFRYVATAWPEWTTQDGGFRFGALAPGKLRLVAWPLVPGLAPRSVDVDIARGRNPAALELALDDAETGTVVLEVRDDRGKAVRNVEMEALRDGKPVQGLRAESGSPTGVYEVPFAAGPYAVSVRTRDGKLVATTSGEVRAGERTRVEVALRPK